jgi:hypothetical protein
MVVANIYSFSNANRNILIGGKNQGGIELSFYNNELSYGCTGKSEYKIQLNNSMEVNTLQENAINIFTFTCDKNGNFNAYINSKHINTNPVKISPLPINQPIILGSSFIDGKILPSNNSIDYYNFLHWSGVIDLNNIQTLEWYFACKYRIKRSISNSNKHRQYNFSYFPF